MLVLTRKLGESIRIGDTISVKIVELNSHHVKLGVEAPRDISVNREEVYERIQTENREASASQDTSIRDVASLFKKKKKK